MQTHWQACFINVIVRLHWAYKFKYLSYFDITNFEKQVNKINIISQILNVFFRYIINMLNRYSLQKMYLQLPDSWLTIQYIIWSRLPLIPVKIDVTNKEVLIIQTTISRCTYVVINYITYKASPSILSFIISYEVTTALKQTIINLIITPCRHNPDIHTYIHKQNCFGWMRKQSRRPL